VLALFKNFVKRNRPSLDIDAVATGETWFGEDALNRGLCDELRTVDDVLIDYIDSDYDVFQVRYDPPQEQEGLSRLLPVGVSTKSRRLMKRSAGKRNGIISNIIRGLVSTVKEEIINELEDSYAVGNRNEDYTRQYMLHDGDVSRNMKSEI
jgi:ClpP class serine protease